jgi:hypothetical protein
LRSRTLGTRERCEPTFAVETDDRSISVLAEYQHSGLPSLAARDVGEWKTVFCGEPELPEDLLAGLLRYAGIQRTVEGPGEYAQIGGGWLSVHAVQKGLRTIRLPVGALLYDALQERLVDGAGQERRVELGAKTTGIFYIGSPEEIRKLGLPGALEVSGRARRGRRAPASAPETSDEPPTEAPLAVDADAAGGPEEAPAPQAEGADAEEAEDSTERKRRRRRGSRGRRRRPSGAAEPAPEAPPAE